MNCVSRVLAREVQVAGEVAVLMETVMTFLGSPSKSPRNGNERYVMSIDQGTSSSRCMVFDEIGKVIGMAQREHKQHYPSPGMVEHDPEEIWEAVKACVEQVMDDNGLSASNIAALGITNQRETSVVWNKHTGKPYHRAIVWNDTRTLPICEKLSKGPNGPAQAEMITTKTGLPVSPYFSATKIVYMLDGIPGLRNAAEAGDALFGTIDSWLVWKLTAGHVHVTDVTNASRTLLMNLRERKWDSELLQLLNVPLAMLPQIRSSSESYGIISEESAKGGLSVLNGVVIAGILGDQQAALFGQACFQPGDTKVTYGTGAFLMMNTGAGVQAAVPSSHGLLTTVAYQLGPDAEPHYALEGSVAYCGSLIQWLRDNLHLIKNASQSEELALTVQDNGGVYFVPAFSGLFAPYWRGEARGIITGLTAYNTRAHITRAALEAAAFQTNEIIDAMIADSGTALSVLKVDGGMTKNCTLMQFQSDLLNTPLICPVMAETTALGSAYAAGLAVGYYDGCDQLAKNYHSDKAWKPAMVPSVRGGLLRNWRKAVARSLNWTEQEGAEEDEVYAANNKLISQLSVRKDDNADAGAGADADADTTTASSSSSSGVSSSVYYWTGVKHATVLLLAATAVAIKFDLLGCPRKLNKKN